MTFFDTDRSHIKKIEGLQYKHIPGDGNCLYQAVSLHLNEDQNILRNKVATYIESNREKFESFFSDPDRNLEKYLNSVRTSKEWATHIEIEVLMQVLQQPIVVIEKSGNIQTGMGLERFTQNPIFVFYNGHNHYDAMILDNTLSGKKILENLQKLTETNTEKTSSKEKKDQSLLPGL